MPLLDRALTPSPPITLRLYTLPYWTNPSFLFFDIRALWCSGLSARASEYQKLKMVGCGCNVCMFLLWLPYGVINYNKTIIIVPNHSNSNNLEQLALKGLKTIFLKIFVKQKITGTNLLRNVLDSATCSNQATSCHCHTNCVAMIFKNVLSNLTAAATGNK